MADEVKKVKGWRHKYNRYIVKSVEMGLQSPTAALAMSKAGIKHMHDNFDFVRDGKSMKFSEAMRTIKGSFETGTVKGSKSKPKAGYEVEVPYGDKVLKGEELLTQIDNWVQKGTIEMSCGHAMSMAVRNPQWLDLSDSYFVLLGAGSAMGPFLVLLALGANIVAVDLDRAGIWQRLIGLVENSSATMTFPLKQKQSTLKTKEEMCAQAGCDLFKQTPEIRNWLLAVHPGKQLIVGAYAYLNGALFVQVSLAMDAIVQDLTEKRKASVAYLCTPTDTHVIPYAALMAAKKNYKNAPMWLQLMKIILTILSPVLKMFKLGPMLKINARKPITGQDGSTFAVVDALVVAQGPNYCLAKRLQHWRAMVARDAGCVVSSNIAPATATASVVQNKQFAAAYGGFKYFKCMEVFYQETSNAVMTLLMIHDIRNSMSVANPEVPLRNPLELFGENQFHGGANRCAFNYDSWGPVAVLAFYFVNYVVNSWLFLYNLLQAGGWGYMAALTYLHVSADASAPLWPVLAGLLPLCQYAAGLEVVHAALGMVRSPVGSTLMQVFSRYLVVYVLQICGEEGGPRDIIFFRMVCVAWCTVEVIRYSFYACNCLGLSIYPLTWLRYSAFIVLYPLGVSGEIGCLWASIPALQNVTLMGPVTLGAFIKFVVLPGYLPGLPILYSYMVAQRTKALGGGAKKVKKD